MHLAIIIKPNFTRVHLAIQVFLNHPGAINAQGLTMAIYKDMNCLGAAVVIVKNANFSGHRLLHAHQITTLPDKALRNDSTDKKCSACQKHNNENKNWWNIIIERLRIKRKPHKDQANGESQNTPIA